MIGKRDFFFNSLMYLGFRSEGWVHKVNDMSCWAEAMIPGGGMPKVKVIGQAAICLFPLKF